MARGTRRRVIVALLLCAAATSGSAAKADTHPPPAEAHPEGWLVLVEGGIGAPLTKPQRDLFLPGGTAAASVVRSLGPHLLAGLRLRTTVLLNGKAPTDPTIANPGLGGLGAVMAVARLRPLAQSQAATRAQGAWIDLGMGAGLTGSQLRATGEMGAGWTFHKGGWLFGPAVRYQHVLQPQHALGGADAKLALVGLELTFFDRKPPPPSPPPPPKAPTGPPPAVDTDGDGVLDPDDRCVKEPEDKDAFEDADGCPDPDNDKDGIADASDKCPDEAEVVNAVEDEDGCPDQGLIEMKNDRIVLEERVLFDKNRARVKRSGRPVLRAVLELWKQQGDWKNLVIEGHADVRGPDSYNQWLSNTRAERVRAALVQHGFPATQVEVVAFGRSRPVDDSKTEEAHQRNRRVEFVIIRAPKPASDGNAAQNTKP